MSLALLALVAMRCGVIEPFDGDLDDYQKYLLEEAKRAREAA